MLYDQFVEAAPVKKYYDPAVKKSPSEIKAAGRAEIAKDYELKLDKERPFVPKPKADSPKERELGKGAGPAASMTKGSEQGKATDVSVGLQYNPKVQPKAVKMFDESPLQGLTDSADKFADTSDYKKESEVRKEAENHPLIKELRGNLHHERHDAHAHYKEWVDSEPDPDLDDTDPDKYRELVDEWDNAREDLQVFHSGMADVEQAYDEIENERYEPELLRDLIRIYTSTGHYDLNRYLRYGPGGFQKGLTEEQERGYQLMAHLIKDQMMRAVGGNTYFRGVSNLSKLIGNLKEGDIIRDPGFMSVSADELEAGQFGELMEVTPDYSVFGYEVDGHADSILPHGKEEEETILPPNLMLRYMGMNRGKPRFMAYDGSGMGERELNFLLAGRDEFGDPFDLEEGTITESKRSPTTHSFLDRMNDFHFQTIRKPTKSFSDFTNHDD